MFQLLIRAGVLILVSLFVMDWFKRSSGESVDLWVANTCDPSFGCISTSFERHGWGEFRPYAIMTLWTTGMSAVMVLSNDDDFWVVVAAPAGAS